MKFQIILLLLIIPGSIGIAYGHTVDAVGLQSRNWMDE